MWAAIALGLYFAVRSHEFKAGMCFSIPGVIKLFPPLLLFYPV